MSSERRRRTDSNPAARAGDSTAIAPGKQARTEGLPIQRKERSSGGGGLPFLDVMLKSNMNETAAAGVAGNSVALPHLDRIQASFGAAHDLSAVRAGVGGEAGRAAAEIGASAYATGDRTAFQHAPDLHTAAHEAAHVVQQRSGLAPEGGVGRKGEALERQADVIADRVVQGESSADLLPTGGGGAATRPAVQMRRVPGDVAPLVDETHDGGEPANVGAHRKGLRLVIERAEAVLKNADAKHGTEHFKNYMKEAMAGLAADEIVDPGELLVRKSEALRKVVPVLELGDPDQREVGARRGTEDGSNMRKLVRNATKIFDEIASGSRDTDVADVFGAEHVGTAKRNYARARRELRRIVRDDELLTDRSGFSDEVGLGGDAWYRGPIRVERSVIDKPDDPESIRIIIHESMHAGNPDIHDAGNYAGSGDAFTTEAAAVKLANAAHYEVVPSRILGLEHAFVGIVFVPAGTAAATATGPGAPLSAMMEAQRAVAFELRNAWARAMDIYEIVREVRLDPGAWRRRLDQQRYSTVLRFWSRVLKLTIHEKTDIDVRSRDPARLPVSGIDLALAEGVARKLLHAKGNLPGTEHDIAAFEETHSTEAERTAAHTSFESHRDFLKRLVLGLPNVAPITGSLDRDMGVATELGTRTWEQVANPGGADASDEIVPSPAKERREGDGGNQLVAID